MTLDYESVRQTTKSASLSRQKKKEEPLTEKELASIQFYVEDMEKNILKLAQTGKDKFIYDCSKLSEKMFLEIAISFKKKNPLFFVVTAKGSQMLTVEWSGKYEV